MQTDRGKKWNEIRMRLFKMVSVGVVDDPINQGYDIVSTLMLIVNLIGAFANTFDGVRAQYASLLDLTEEITVAFFALDYALRLVTAKCLYPQLTEGRALAKYMLSAGGIVDLLSFLPFYLPFFFPRGGVPAVPRGAYFPPVPHQCVLRFAQRYHRGHRRQKAAAFIVGVHHSRTDARLEPVHVLA